MIAAALAASLLLSPQVLTAPEVAVFPGSTYDVGGRESLQRRALAVWPGPSGLLGMWHSGELTGEHKMAVLLGAAAFHDPQLIVIYREAINSNSQRARQAAVYGYRDLLADRLPYVVNGVSDQQVEAYKKEMDLVAATLRGQPLVVMWLNNLLAVEGAAMPGFSGVIFTRRTADSLRALETLAGAEDLELLVHAYRSSENISVRLSLLKLIQGIRMKRFFVKPAPGAGWGMADIERGFDALDRWIADSIDRPCSFDFEAELATAFSELNAPPLPPMSADACAIWQNVLLKGDHSWWPQAARRLYFCGGPAVELSVFQAQSEANMKRRDALVSWYGLR